MANLQIFLGFLKYSGLAYFLKLMLPDLTDSDSTSDGVGLGVRVTPRKSTPIRSSLLYSLIEEGAGETLRGRKTGS